MIEEIRNNLGKIEKIKEEFDEYFKPDFIQIDIHLDFSIEHWFVEYKCYNNVILFVFIVEEEDIDIYDVKETLKSIKEV